MIDPFASALDAIFYAPGSAEAYYSSDETGRLPDPIRVIRSQPDADASLSARQIVQSTNQVEIRVSDIRKPKAGDQLELPTVKLQLVGEAMIDTEGLSHTCGAIEIP